jgi:hypothetical protein
MGAIQNIVNELRRRGVVVHEWSGWQNRGNGPKDLDVKGIILHHTGSNYGSAYPELVSSSQPWANGGALCNFSGNSDGSLTVIAAGLTYHAGGGYGPNQGPLAPYANNRNYHTVGLEIVYPGSKPMTYEQYVTAVILSRVVVDMYAGGNADYVRAHAEVNGRGYQGKWDPGKGVGTEHIDMDAFRNAVRNGRAPGGGGTGDFLMALSAEQQQYIYDSLVDIRTDLTIPYTSTGVSTGNVVKYLYEAVVDIRNDLAKPYLANNKSTGEVITDLEARLTAIEDLIKAIQVGVIDYDRLGAAVANMIFERLDVDIVRKGDA